MATSPRPSPSSSRDREPRPPSFLQSALGLLRGQPRPARDESPTIRVMFAENRAADDPAGELPPAHEDPDAMRRALKAELNRVRGSRHVLRHLAKVEHDLKTQGLALFERLPGRVLQTALAQLDSLVAPPVPPGVAALRSRLAVALLARERVEPAPARTPASRPAPPGGAARLGSGTAPPVGNPNPVGSPGTPGSVHGAREVGPGRAAMAGGWSAWGGEAPVEVRESSFADFEQATTEWQLLDEPRRR